MQQIFFIFSPLFLMDTNRLPDYSHTIVIPTEIPEDLDAHYTALRRAKEVIDIISLSALSVETSEYDILHGSTVKMVLPSQYQF